MAPALDPINVLKRASSRDTGVDRQALAGLLVEVARNVDPDYRASVDGVPSADPRMAALRQVLVGHEISELSRIARLLGEPEQLARAISGVLPDAAALASRAQLGEALAPVVETATQRSIRKDPRTFTDILYPLILPAIRKSIEEKIDQTFQSLNESIKHIFTWRGLRWRIEAWRTGASFAEVVLRHSLVYQVEHAFLIHRSTGLLITHVACQDATSEDPQLVSSMMSAVQDFVRDSFKEKEHDGLDAIRLGSLRLWSESGPFATLVVVIRGNPPEAIHTIVRDVLLRLHEEHGPALQAFDGDSSGLTEIEAPLRTCVDLGQKEMPRAFPWLVVAAVVLIVFPTSVWLILSWQSANRWHGYIARLESQPGIVVTDQRITGGHYHVSGLRDPLAADPAALLTGVDIDPARIHARWRPYRSLEPEFVLKRLTASLQPPQTVRMSIDGGRIVASGEASDAWLADARAASTSLSTGGPIFDILGVRNVDPGRVNAERWQAYLQRLKGQPGIVVTEHSISGERYYVSGFRDPLAADPAALLTGADIDPARVHAHWRPYRSLEPEFVLKRLTASLRPPQTVRMSIDGGRIVASGEASDAWLADARAASANLSAGGPVFDISDVRSVDPGRMNVERWQAYLQRLEDQSGIVITGQNIRGERYFITGLRDHLAFDPMALLAGTGIDPAKVDAQWQLYESLQPEIVLKRLIANLVPPKSVTMSVDEDRIVAAGEAPAGWINRAQVAAQRLSISGVTFDISSVQDFSLGELSGLKKEIESTAVFFDSGKPVPSEKQMSAVLKLAEDIKQLTIKALNAGVTVHFTLTGHSDATGRDTANLSISVARAETVRALLNRRGVAPSLLSVRGAGTFEPAAQEVAQTGSSANRRVAVTVVFE